MAVACNMILHPVSSIDRWYEHEFCVFSSSLLHFSTVILIHSKVVAYVCAYILINVFVCPRYFFSSVVFRYAYPPPPPSSCRIWCIRIIESFVFEWRKKWREKKTMIENDTCFPCIVLDGVNIPYTCNVCDVILLLFFFCSTIFFFSVTIWLRNLNMFPNRLMYKMCAKKGERRSCERRRRTRKKMNAAIDRSQSINMRL